MHENDPLYQADDSDLPDFIMGRVDAPAPKEIRRPLVPPTARELERERRAHERSVRQENQEAIDEARKIYIKSAKRQQMLVWLLALHGSPKLTPWEQRFCLALLVRFRKYKRVEWLTKRQFECLRRIAQKHRAVQSCP